MPKLNLTLRNFLTGGLLALAAAGYCFYLSLPKIADSFGQDAWSTTKAEVVEAHQTTTRRASGGVRVSSHFRYEYVVNDVKYSSSRYSLRFASGDPSTAVANLNRGDVIDIYYDPADPDSAVVVKGGAGIFVYFMAGLGLLFMLMGLSITLFGDALALQLFLLERFAPSKSAVTPHDEK